MRLRPVQLAALVAAQRGRCLFGQIPVGSGKTLICGLLPAVIPCTRPLLLVPAAVRTGTLSERARYTLPDCELWTYERLSSPSHRDDLREYAPDLLIMDEAHLAAGDSARGRRLGEYVRAESPRVCVLSGTLLAKPERACILARWVWGDASPLPTQRRDVASFARVLRGEGDAVDWVRWARVYGEDLDFAEKIARTRGAIVAPPIDVDAGLEFETIPWALPQVVRDALRRLESDWELPGAIVCDAMQVASLRRQLRTGFYYRWISPPSRVWTEARREWARALRRYLQRPRALDSEALIVRALLRGEHVSDEVKAAWALWRSLRSLPPPPTEPVWLDGSLIAEAAALGRERGALVWARYTAEAAALAAAGLPLVPRGVDPSAGACVVRVGTHGTGRNLQTHSENVLLAPLAARTTAQAWEQLLGRTHRPGQSRGVRMACYVPQGAESDLDAAVESAERDAAAMGASKLLRAMGRT